MGQINRIKAVLAEKQKTNNWLAEQVGKDTSTVSKWCTNRSQPSIDMFKNSTMLGCGPEGLTE